MGVEQATMRNRRVVLLCCAAFLTQMHLSMASYTQQDVDDSEETSSSTRSSAKFLASKGIPLHDGVNVVISGNQSTPQGSISLWLANSLFQEGNETKL